jgi:hypothetical protein
VISELNRYPYTGDPNDPYQYFGFGTFLEDANEVLYDGSPDGRHWTEHRTGSVWAQSGVTYGDGRYVVVGATGSILTSEQGTEWQRVESGTKQSLSGVASGNSRFVAVGNGGTILTSPDGRNWQIAQQEGEGVDRPWIWSVTYGDGRFVAVGDSLTAWVSTDGMTWRTVQLQPNQ